MIRSLQEQYPDWIFCSSSIPKKYSIGLRISHGSLYRLPRLRSFSLRFKTAEAERFELSRPFRACRLSKAVH
ncbi:MAG: hypothetical protein RLZZ26_493 [Candidatus Parcubacteria bacterium]